MNTPLAYNRRTNNRTLRPHSFSHGSTLTGIEGLEARRVLAGSDLDTLWAVNAYGTGSGYGTDDDSARAVAVWQDGSTIVAGSSAGTVGVLLKAGLNTLTSNGGKDVVAVKLNPDGSPAWAINVGGSGDDEATAVATCSDGSAIITGTFTGTVTFPGGTTLVSKGPTDTFVAKLSSAGSFVWAVRMGGTGPNAVDRSTSVSTFPDGSSLVAGHLSGPAEFGGMEWGDDTFRYFVVKVTASGDCVWAMPIQGFNDWGRLSVAAFADGSSVVAGGYISTVTVGSTTLTTPLSSFFVAKLDSNGNCVWATQPEDGVATAWGISTLKDGSIFVLARGAGLTFAGKALSPGFSECVAKLDMNGNPLWATAYSIYHKGESIYAEGGSIASLPDGSALVVGTFVNDARFGNVTISSRGGCDVYAARINASGQWTQANTAGGSGDDLGYGVAALDDGSAVVCGDFRSTALLGSVTLQSSWLSDPFVWKVKAGVTPVAPGSPVAVSATVGDATVSLSWAAPSDDGGSPITGYMVRYSADDKVTWSTPMSVGASPTALTIPGLVNGHKYWFEIASQNAVGLGSYSDSIFATPNGTVEFLFTVNNGEATITDYKGSSPVEDVPSSIGGYPVTGLVRYAHRPGLGLSNYTVTSLRIPATVKVITGTYYAYGALKSIEVDVSNTTFASFGGILYSKDMQTLIQCPVRLEGQVNVPSGVTTIAAFAFWGCRLIPSITISNTVAEIGHGAFRGSGLSTITLPESVLNIGEGAFGDCRSLTQVNIPAGVKTVPRGSFYSCISLSEVRIAEGVVSIDRSAFDQCQSLVSLTLPASVAYLGSRAFADCRSLARVMFLGNAPAAVDGVFRNDAAAVVCYQRGTSGWTSTYFGIPTATTPGDLSPPSAIGSASSVALSWTAPSDTGGRPISDYRVQYRVDGGTGWIDVDDGVSAATTATVNNLLNGTSYVFRFAAENIAGVGAWSSQSTSATPRIDSPSAPDSLAVISGNGQVSLSWTAPADNGGSSTTAYTIRYSSTGSAPWTYFYSGSTATTATVAGLTNGTSYVFQVAAVNDAGTGAFSDPTPRATPLPAVPGRPTAAAGDGFVILRWAAPRLVRMPRITDYAIRYSSNNGSTWTDYGHTASAATSRRLILTNGNTYIFQVAPVVSGGVGRYSISSLPATPYSPTAKPAAPSGVVGVKTGALISLSWNPVTRNAGGPVKDYVVQYRVYPNGVWKPYDDGVSLTNSANIPLKRLQAGSSYVFRVAAKNLAGVGAYSAPSAPVTALLASISQPPSSPLQISSVYLRPVQRADR